MKKIALISAIALSSLFYNTASAQIRIRVGLHLGLRPIYAAPRVVVEQQPAEYCEPANYDGDEDYYYLPDVDAYYSVPEQCYYYNDGGAWVSAAYLPGYYRDFDWRNARRYEVRAPRPFMHNDYYRTRFSGVAFNARWNDRGYHDRFVNSYPARHDQYRVDNRHFDNNRNNQNWGRDNRQFDQNRGNQRPDQNRGHNDHQFNQNRDNNRGGGQEHFAQNMPQRNDRGNGGHRTGRF